MRVAFFFGAAFFFAAFFFAGFFFFAAFFAGFLAVFDPVLSARAAINSTAWSRDKASGSAFLGNEAMILPCLT